MVCVLHAALLWLDVFLRDLAADANRSCLVHEQTKLVRVTVLSPQTRIRVLDSSFKTNTGMLSQFVWWTGLRRKVRDDGGQRGPTPIS